MFVNSKVLILAAAAALLASAQQCPDDGSKEPAGEIAARDFVELTSTSTCMDPCPTFTVRLRADGLVTWDGRSGVVTKGAATRQVPPAEARALIERLRAHGFWRVCSRPSGVEDGPEGTTTLHIGSAEKSIHGAPDWEIWRAVEALAGTYSWIRADPEMEDLIAARLSDNSFAPRPGFTDLMLAAAQGDNAAIRRELAAGAKVNAQDASGFTALMCAARNGGASAVGALLGAGADANLRSNLGQTALMAASSAGAVSEPLLRLLIAAGADLNAQDRKGVAALMMAVTQSEPTAISMMLGAGARRDLADATGHTALDRVTTALWSIDSESAILANLDVSSKSRRQVGLAIRRRRLEQVRDLLNQVVQ